MNIAKNEVNFKLIPSKEENIKYILMFGMLAFLFITTFALLVALKNEDLDYKLPLVVLIIISFGVFYGSYYGRKKKLEKKEKQVEEDAWKREEKQVKTSKFNNPLEESFNISFLSLGLIIFLSYFSIYLSELLNVVIKFNKSYPDAGFGKIFITEFIHILKEPYSQYIYKYWETLTFFLVIAILFLFMVIYFQKKEEKKKNNF